MNPVDIACLAMLAVSALFGVARGFAREVLGLAAWVGAGLGAAVAFPTLSPASRRLISNVAIADAAAAAIAFIVLLVVFSVVADLLARLVRRTPLGGLDRILGLAFGVVRGAVILVGAYVLGCLVMPPAQWPAVVRTARATGPAYEGARTLISLIPPTSRPSISPPADVRPGSQTAGGGTT